MATLNESDDSVKISALDRVQVLIRNANVKTMFLLSLVSYGFIPAFAYFLAFGI
jgi:hypothetical protein